MNYCKWKTLKDNKKGEIQFLYRLPMHSEWISSTSFVKENNIPIEIDKKYSEWTLNAFDESVYNFGSDTYFDYFYDHKRTDPPVLKRKRVVGESYLYSIPSYGYGNFRYGYSTIGYRQVSFRIVKTTNKSFLHYLRIKE
jgi:hypothetical protein